MCVRGGERGKRDENKKVEKEKCREREGEWIGYDKKVSISKQSQKLLNLSKCLYQQGMIRKQIIEFLR